MNLAGGQHVSYQQTTAHSQTTSHHSQSDSRQGSFASLGPANPIPQNYGSGSPPPFTPPAAVAYPEQSGNNTMPGSSMPGSAMPGSSMPGSTAAAGLVGANGVVNPETMTKGEFEEAKSRGSLPTWAVSYLIYYVLLYHPCDIYYIFRNMVVVLWLVLPL
jgi:hypothetical protein